FPRGPSTRRIGIPTTSAPPAAACGRARTPVRRGRRFSTGPAWPPSARSRLRRRTRKSSTPAPAKKRVATESTSQSTAASRGPPFRPEPAVFKSIDGGATWTKLAAKGLPSPPVGRQALGVVAKSGGRIVLAGLQDGLYRSDDGGETWTRANRDPRITPVGVIT